MHALHARAYMTGVREWVVGRVSPRSFCPPSEEKIMNRMAYLVDRGESSSSSSSSSSSPVIVKHYMSLAMKHYTNNTLIASQVLEDLIGEGKKKERNRDRQTDRRDSPRSVSLPPTVYIFFVFFPSSEKETNDDEQRRRNGNARTYTHARTH